MKPNPIGWFEIYVSDMPRAKRFYEAVFQGTLEELKDPSGQTEMWSFPGDMNAYGAPGALVKMQGVTPGGSTMVYFSCEDCGVEEKRVPAAGGTIERPKMSIGQYGFISLAVDTEGNMFGLHSMQ
jgi:uncharacterized protein